MKGSPISKLPQAGISLPGISEIPSEQGTEISQINCRTEEEEEKKEGRESTFVDFQLLWNSSRLDLREHEY